MKIIDIKYKIFTYNKILFFILFFFQKGIPTIKW